MKHQKNLPMYDLVRKTIREKTHSLQEKKRSFEVYLQKELGEILSTEDIATIFAQKRILMTKKFKEEEQWNLSQYKEMIEKNKAYHVQQKNDAIKQQKMKEISKAVKENTTGLKIFDTLNYRLRVMRYTTMEKKLTKLFVDITKQPFVADLYKKFDYKHVKSLLKFLDTYPEVKNNYTEEWISVGEVWWMCPTIPSYDLLKLLSKLPKPLVEWYRNKKLDPTTSISYPEIKYIYDRVLQGWIGVLRCWHIRNYIKSSTFWRECMIAYLRNDTNVIETFEKIISIALEVRHTDWTNSSTFKHQADNIFKKNVAYYLEDIPQDIIDTYSS